MDLKQICAPIVAGTLCVTGALAAEKTAQPNIVLIMADDVSPEMYGSDNGTAEIAKTRGVERGCHVVFVAKGKGIKARGMTDELTDLSDILPTLVDYAGGILPENYELDGKSLKPFFEGKTDTHREYILSCVGTTRLVRTKDYMLEVVNKVLGIPEV